MKGKRQRRSSDDARAAIIEIAKQHTDEKGRISWKEARQTAPETMATLDRWSQGSMQRVHTLTNALRRTGAIAPSDGTKRFDAPVTAGNGSSANGTTEALALAPSAASLKRERQKRYYEAAKARKRAAQAQTHAHTLNHCPSCGLNLAVVLAALNAAAAHHANH